MSTNSAVLSVDAPPPVPPYSSYPVADLFYPGYALQSDSPTFDPAKPLKIWSRALQPGENPASVIIFGYVSGSQYVADELFMTRADAAATNIAPAGTLAASLAGTTYSSQTIPVPARPLLATESIVASPSIPGAFQVINSANAAAPAPGSSDATEARILAGVEEELAKDGLPPV